MTSRRKILGCIGMLLPGAFLLSFARGTKAKEVAVPNWLRQMADLFPEFENASQIGRRYLELTPGERDARVLASAVSKSIEGSPPALLVDRDRFRSKATHAVRRDFESGNVIMIDGWVLSRTEAQICGLVTLGQRHLAA